MKIGLIARNEIARGIAIQSKNFYDNMPVDRVLLVRMERPDCGVDDLWYKNFVSVDYNALNHTLDEAVVRKWLRGLDVVFTVETPNDWRIPEWCRQSGVKLVIQGNPEFFRHGQPEVGNRPHPDAWWWPTSWRIDHLPAGPVMPVPMTRGSMQVDRKPGPVRIVHVMGKRAWQDRNGTDTFCDALRGTLEPMDAWIYGLDEVLPEMRAQRNQNLHLFPSGVLDRWEMYDDMDVLVLPRKFGGLCLPALEAASRGVAVMMPDVPPNRELAQLFIEVTRLRTMSLPCGHVETPAINHIELARQLDELARYPDRVSKARQEAFLSVPTWDEWQPKYMAELEKLLS